jgi:hypothetical protein
MDRSKYLRLENSGDEVASSLGDAKIFAEESLSGGGSEADDYLRADGFHLGVQPWTAGSDFYRTGFFVDPLLPSQLELEMFYGVGDVHGFAINAGCFEGSRQKGARGSDERLTHKILFVSRLLSHEHHSSF